MIGIKEIKVFELEPVCYHQDHEHTYKQGNNEEGTDLVTPRCDSLIRFPVIVCNTLCNIIAVITLSN